MMHHNGLRCRYGASSFFKEKHTDRRVKIVLNGNEKIIMFYIERIKI